MMIKYENHVITFLKENELNIFIKRKTVSKAIESFRIKDNTKEELKELRKLFK